MMFLAEFGASWQFGLYFVQGGPLQPYRNAVLSCMVGLLAIVQGTSPATVRHAVGFLFTYGGAIVYCSGDYSRNDYAFYPYER